MKNNTVDASQTNICDALEFTATLFKDNVIKRIVIISDGKETNESNIVSIVNNLASDNIYVDAMYIDNNITDKKEIQINQVEYNSSTFLNMTEKVIATIQSSSDAKAIVTLYCDDEEIDQRAIYINEGYNTVSFELNTKDCGDHLYKLEVSSEDDISTYNNSYLFNQKVTEKLKVLFVSNENDDKEAAIELYGESTEIDFYINDVDVPYTIEDLCSYDEFVLSNVDIRTLHNYSQFINSLDTLVSEFGKSMITIGNTYIQNNDEDETLSYLSDMLPVKYGNDEHEKKLVTIVLDISRSMGQTGKLICAKSAAQTIIEKLDDNVDVMLIPFFGEVGNPVLPTSAKEKDKLIQEINKYGVYQGTFLGAALKYAYKFVNDLKYEKNEIVLISDGLPYGEQKTETLIYAQKIKERNIKFSFIHVSTVVEVEESGEFSKSVASTGGGKYYYLDDVDDVKSLIIDDVFSDLNEVVLDNSSSPVEILRTKDSLVKDIEALPDINGLYNNSKKSSATVVLEATYTDINGNSYKIPLYSYWNYGNGKVTSFASKVSGTWINSWKEDVQAKTVLRNVMSSNIPDSRVDSAFIIETNITGTKAEITVNAPSLNSNSILEATIIYPNKIQENKVLTFDSQNYATEIITAQIGEYIINLSYQLGELKYEASYKFYVSYLPEYNSFTLFEASNLYYMVSSNGQISENGKLALENNNSEVQKYIFDFTPVFMIICAVLFIIDIIIRKLRWQDIKSIFKLANKDYVPKKESNYEK